MNPHAWRWGLIWAVLSVVQIASLFIGWKLLTSIVMCAAWYSLGRWHQRRVVLHFTITERKAA